MKYAYATANWIYKLKGYSRVVNGQILNCKMPIKAYKDGVEVATIDCGRDLLFNDTLTTDGKVDIGSGKVDLGTLNWWWIDPYQIYIQNVNIGQKTYGDNEDVYMYCTKYGTYPKAIYQQPTKPNDKEIARNWSTNNFLIVRDNDYINNVDAFKTAMNGVMLDYELATHTTSTFTPIPLKDNLTFVDDNGYEVEVVESNFEVKKWKAVRKWKNLFEVGIKEDWVQYGGYHLIEEIISNKIIVSTKAAGGTLIYKKTFIENNGAMTFSYDYKGGYPPRAYIQLYDENKQLINDSSIKIQGYTYNTYYKGYFKQLDSAPYDGHKVFTFDLPSEVKYCWVGIGAGAPINDKLVEFFNIQLEEGSTATAYEPYGPKSYLPTTRLPLEYQEVKYLESTGTQWIDTGYVYKRSLGDKIKLVLQITSTQSDTAFFGNYTTNAFELGKLGNTIMLNVSAQIPISEVEAINKIITATCINGVWSVNGITKEQNISMDRDITAILFGRLYNGVVDKKGACKYLEFVVERDDAILCDFVPCYRRSDHKPGMYDTVNNAFHTNQGTGEFILGEEI